MTDLLHSAFYRYVRIGDAAAVAAVVREIADGLLGSVLLANEGLNGALAGTASQLDDFERALCGDARLQGLFNGLAFRRSACRTAPFGRLRVQVRREVLALGVDGVDAVCRPGTQLAPHEWRAVLDAGDSVVIDNRSRFEHRLGRFRGAVDPQVGNFRDLPGAIAAQAPRWRAEKRTVAMYCTGGIRCEKTAAWLLGAFDLEVLQLGGGILRYLAEAPAAERAADWQGECFVFDNRIALDANLQEAPTRAVDVYGAGGDDEAWRLRRAERLAAAVT